MTSDSHKGLSLILGGARSGKSVFAENIALSSERKLIYIATAQSLDSEMSDRITEHQSRRGSQWQTIEEPIDLRNVLKENSSPDTCILVDCLTLWLANISMGDLNPTIECNALIDCLGSLPEGSDTLLISNEVGHGIVPMDSETRAFRDQSGILHQGISSIADHVWFITAGLGQKLK